MLKVHVTDVKDGRYSFTGYVLLHELSPGMKDKLRLTDDADEHVQVEGDFSVYAADEDDVTVEDVTVYLTNGQHYIELDHDEDFDLDDVCDQIQSSGDGYQWYLDAQIARADFWDHE